MPPDPLDLLGQHSAHWAGNINVLVGRKATERHAADALRFYAGRLNKALLLVGNHLPDAYTFGLTGEVASWNLQLSAYVVRSGSRPAEQIRKVELGRPYDASGPFLVGLSVLPPATCERGELAVHVTQRSTGRTAIVEFSLDATARGPGCYTA